jgi:prepilin-type N-terminal cleavage/methylation domain-containing protein
VRTVRRSDRARRGFTLMEVMVATVILGGALLALASFAAKFARANATASISLTANDLAVERIEAGVKMKSTYLGIDSLRATESTFPGAPHYQGYTRRTDVTRIGGRAGIDPMDYKVVTVTITHARLTKPVARTVVVAAF